MTVIIRCVDFGVYDIRQTRQHYTQPVTLERDHTDWQLHNGPSESWRFTTFAEAKAWLNGPDGEAWLDQLPRAEVTR